MWLALDHSVHVFTLSAMATRCIMRFISIFCMRGYYPPTPNNPQLETKSSTMYPLRNNNVSVIYPHLTEINSVNTRLFVKTMFNNNYSSHYNNHLLFCPLGGNLCDSEVEDLFDYVYSNLIEEVDGVDNGIESFEGIRK